MDFIFVRHGQTDWNKQKLILGHVDRELNEKGIQQADELLPALEELAFDVIFSSPFKRAIQTAKIISEHFNLPIIKNDNLKERDFGSLVGKSWEENGKTTGMDLKAIDRKMQYDYRLYGGESAEQVKSRVLAFIDAAKASGYSKPLVVSHAGIIRMLHHLYSKVLPPGFPTIENSSIHRFTIP